MEQHYRSFATNLDFHTRVLRGGSGTLGGRPEMGLRWERKGGGVGGVGLEFAGPRQLAQKRSPWATHGTRVTLTPSRDARLHPEAKVDMSTFAQEQKWTCPHFGKQSVLLKNKGAHQKVDMSRFENSKCGHVRVSTPKSGHVRVSKPK